MTVVVAVTLSMQPVLNVKGMEIRSSLSEIMDAMKKLRDAYPADVHQDIVKQDIVTVTMETNLRRSEVKEEEVVTLTAACASSLVCQQSHEGRGAS